MTGTATLCRKEKEQRKSIQVFLLLGILLPDLNRLVSHDLEKTELGLGTQNFDLAAITQLAIFVKREEKKVDCMDQCLTSDALSQPLVRHLIVDYFVQDYLTSVFGNHGWTKYQEQIETCNIDLFFPLCTMSIWIMYSGSFKSTINCNLASNFCFCHFASYLLPFNWQSSQRKFPPLELILSLESSAKKHYMNQFILS